MGTEAVVQAAEQYGKMFICSEKIAAVDLQEICHKVKSTSSYFTYGKEHALYRCFGKQH